MAVQAEVPAPDIPPSVAAAWGVRERPHKGPKPALSLARIVDAGVRVADAEGLDAVSMGRVAASLDTAPMSLYRHVSSKEELLRLMVDAAWGDSPGPLADGEDWRDGLARWAWAMRAALRRHPWAARLPISGLPILPREIAWFEDALACLAGTGLTEARKASVILLLSGYVRNLATTEADIAAAVAASGLSADEWMASYPRMLSQLTDPRRFPALTTFIAAGVFEAADEPDDEFVFGLDRILDGVGALVSRLRLVEVVALVEVRDKPGLGGAHSGPSYAPQASPQLTAQLDRTPEVDAFMIAKTLIPHRVVNPSRSWRMGGRRGRADAPGGAPTVRGGVRRRVLARRPEPRWARAWCCG